MLFHYNKMTKRKTLVVSILMIGILGFWSCTPQRLSSVKETTTLNSKKSLQKPYLILISLDGFRWDYVERFNPPNLSNFIENGVQAESLIPSFPSKTFPNHYTIATGMYPDKHGLVGNSFYSYEKKTIYSLGDREKVEDGTFYGGSPIWITANKAGLVTASYFFVGSEADIQGIHPTYYYRFDNSVEKKVRVAQALEWLNMPEKQRPHLITMYFSDMDNTGHRFGPNNDEQLKKTLMELDAHLGDLFKGVEQSGLPVNIIIVSDHGMFEVPVEKYLPIEQVYHDDLYLTVNSGAIVNIHPKTVSQTDSIFQLLKAKEDHFKVYKTKDAPYFEYVPQNKNWGAIQIIPDPGYYFKDLRGININKRSDRKVFGEHGFDPGIKDMHGIFYGKGPAFKKGYTIPSVKNIHIYPLMCRILDLKIPNDIDGRLDPIKSVLKK
jgi:predicted AlkP superfamily pyrophosphatase or phosphodiesterase